MDLVEAMEWLALIFVSDMLASVAYHLLFERGKSGKRFKPFLFRLLFKLLE